MRIERMKGRVPVKTLFSMMAVLAVVARVACCFPQYAQQTGKACSYCHVNPAGGKDLTAAGQYYKTNKTLEGYVPPEATPAPTPPPVPEAEPPPMPPTEAAPTPAAPEETPAPAAPPTQEMPPTTAAPSIPTEVTGAEQLPAAGMNELSFLVFCFGLVSTGALLYRRKG